MNDQIIKVTQMKTNAKPVSPTLEKMELGAIEKFPLEQLNSLYSTRYRLRRLKGINFSMTTNLIENEITVTRIQ